ncbi:MAG: hypothetical protein ACR2PZ_01810 [Pseudomonadales bacterium]
MSKESPGPHDLDQHRAILSPASRFHIKAMSPEFYQELDAEFDGFRGHTLVSQFQFDAAWGVWEMHPQGDELVYLLSGDTDFILRDAAGERRVRVSTPGQYVVVPQGAWHTAEPHEPTHMLFITPGEGTQNLEQPPL